jgi:hypothetical protein
LIQALVAFLAPLVIQFLKRSTARGLSWLDQAKPKYCVLTNFALALLTNAGITFAHTPGSLLIHWPDLTTAVAGALTFLFTVLVQFLAQHLLYGALWKHVVKSPTNEPGHSLVVKGTRGLYKVAAEFFKAEQRKVSRPFVGPERRQ